LKLLKPEAEERINNNLVTFQNALDQDREYALSQLELVKNKNLITEHNAFGYFTKDLGLQFLGSLEQTHQNESEADYLYEITEMIKAYQVATIYAEPNSQSGFVEIFAKDYGLQISYLDAEGIQVQDYLEMMRFNVDNILGKNNESN
jgi:zinc transport system substrate-binding protein